MDKENLKKRNRNSLSVPKSKQEQQEQVERLLANENEDDDFSDDELPYGGKVYLARRRKPDSWACIALQVFLVLGVFGLAYYSYYYFEHMHVNVMKAYAHLGYDTAQHELGNRYLHGVGVEKHHEKAMEYFKMAADQGHPHAAYNLAVGHLKGLKTPINKTEAKRLIEHAANNGVNEAVHTLNNICNVHGC